MRLWYPSLVSANKTRWFAVSPILPLFVSPAAGRDVHLAPENRIHAALLGVIVKDDRRKHVAVLGHRQRRHLQPRSLIEQLVDAARAVEQRKLGVTMKVNEVLISHWIWEPVSPKRGANGGSEGR